MGIYTKLLSETLYLASGNMMRNFFKILTVLAIVSGAFFSCSRKSTSFLSRGYHATTAEYNILFHAKENLNKGLEELKKKKEADFYSELSLEGIEFDDKIYLPGQSKSNYISKAEEKATKAVQKHSMEIRGSEYNPKMDEAMLLLGMSRYYDQRYLSALDAINYALDTYYDTNLRNELLLWRAKTLLKLGNTQLARDRLTSIAFDGDTKPDTRAWAYAFIAESYRENGLNDTVAEYYSLAARTAKNKELRHTLAYKAAQVWEKLFKKDSALALTDFILQDKSPEKFILYTQLYRMHLTKEDTATHEKNLKKLQRYLNNYYFNRYFPDLHYRYGEIMEVRGDTAAAVMHYTGAARSPNKTLKRLAYNKMADIYWDKKDYLNTGKYLDSMLTVMDKDKLDYLLVSQRRRSIDKIVKWEEVIRRNDSILRFIRLDTAEQRRKIEAYIASLRKKQEAELLEPQKENEKEGTFYFYNTEQVKKGKELFRQRWGERRLEDLWRLSNKHAAEEENEIKTEKENVAATGKTEEDTLSVAYFMNRLPQTQREIDSIKNLITKAHLLLGINYANDKFREYDLAKQHIDTVLISRPVPEQMAQAYYMLYKIYTKKNEPEKARTYADKLLKEFPDSPFAQYILHPESAEASSSKELREDFRRAYTLFKEENWEAALQEAEKGFNKHKEHPDAPKFLFLAGKIKGKLYGIDPYIRTLEEIVRLYPEGEYHDLAKEQLKKLRFLKAKYSVKKDEFPFFLVHVYTDTTGMDGLKQCLNDIYREEEVSSKYFFTDRFNQDTLFLISGDYLSRESAEYVLEKLKEKKSCPLPPTFIISKQNYINLQLTKGKIPVP